MMREASGRATLASPWHAAVSARVHGSKYPF